MSTRGSVATIDDGSTRITALSNDELIIQLINTLNHLSRWLTPVHDRTLLEFSPRRAELSIKDVLLDMRDTEARIFALMHAIAAQDDPDLDRVPRAAPSSAQIEDDRASNVLTVMSEFRRIRQSSTSLLRSLPDSAWDRGGFSRTERDWTIRELARFLAQNDLEKLAAIDNMLMRSGVRQNIAGASRVSLAQIGEPFSPATELARAPLD